MNINITIEKKHCTVLGTPVIVCGNTGYTITFTFDAEWDTAGDKTARFSYVRDGKRLYQDAPVIGNTVEVPAVYRTMEVQVGVYAGDLVTSTPARIPCKKSIICDTCTPDDPIPVSRESGGTYELIEDITLTEDAATFRRSTTPDGTPYNFSSVRIFTEIPACGGSGTNHQLILRLGVSGDSWYYYWGVRDGIKAAENRDTIFVARNDHGFIDTYGSTTASSQRSGYATVSTQPFIFTKPWKNVNMVELSLFPSSLVFPVGTRIRIYGIWED